MSKANKSVRIVEMGLRDGLQNEKKVLSVEQRTELFSQFIKAGLKNIEIGAFVSPKWVPQMAGTDQLVEQIDQKFNLKSKKFEGSVLVPNEIGMQNALKTNIKEVAVFISATEAFSKANINCTIAESLERSKKVLALAKKNKIKVRGYISVCFGCPYEGKVSEAVVIKLAKELIKMGCFEVSIGDTIGIANPLLVENFFKKLVKVIPKKKIAGHFHDTRGLALANIYASYRQGIAVFDSSTGGLGGCPYAKGATGNVATEDVISMFHSMGVSTGIDLAQIVKTSHWLETVMEKPMSSKIAKVMKEI